MGQTPAVAMMILALAGCGGSSSGTKPTAAPAPTQPQPIAKTTVAPPDDPKLAFAKVVLADLAAGNVEALVKLADPLAVLEKTAECKVVKSQKLNIDPKQAPVHAARDTFSRRVDKTRGLKIEVLALASAAPASITTGTELAEGCVAKRDLVHHAISVKIRAQRDTKPAVEQTVTIKGVELDGRWYLIEVPTSIQEKESSKAMRDAVTKMTDFTDRMCKCKDKACADKVQDDLIKWATELAKTTDRDEQPDPELAKQAAEIMTRYTECMTKIMMGS